MIGLSNNLAILSVVWPIMWISNPKFVYFVSKLQGIKCWAVDYLSREGDKYCCSKSASGMAGHQ